MMKGRFGRDLTLAGIPFSTEMVFSSFRAQSQGEGAERE